MTLDTFFEKFDLFADAPGAVARMRELVLELAVQGRLASALPSDSPVQSVVEFRKDTAALAVSLGLRSPIESIEEAIPSFDVPIHWQWVALADIGVAQTGTTPTRADREVINGEIPFIKPADILPNAIDYSNERLTRRGAEGGSRLAPSGSLLMVCIGTIGKCNLIERECAFNQQINSLTPVAAVDSRYLLVAARSRYFQHAAWEKSSSTTIAILNKGKWLSIAIPIPPLAEQKRIVAKVDELMALCDQLEAQQQERQPRHTALARASLSRFADAPTPANLDFIFHPSYDITPADLRKSILTLAVQGKLVRFEPESDTQIVGDHIEFQNGYAFKSQWFKPSGMRLCRNVNVSHGVVDWRESAFVDDDIAKEFERFALSEGDIVLSLDRPLIATGLKVARIRESDLPCLLLQRVAKPVRKHDRLDMSYFFLWLNSSEFVDSIDPGRSNGVPHIFTKQVLLLPFILPPLAAQRRIIAKVDQLMALVDELEVRLSASRASAAKLLSGLVTELTSH
ncbi:MAG: restriction endonuclease subunit S [Xanthomonadales bacterium]|nr:restriction endonuclease subunit S [Xanthomonadales bacterium]